MAARGSLVPRFVGSNPYEPTTQAYSGNDIWLCGAVIVLGGGSVPVGLQTARLGAHPPFNNKRGLPNLRLWAVALSWYQVFFR
jgi:hypothetical protein